MKDFTDFLNSDDPPVASAPSTKDHSDFLDAPDTRTETKGHRFQQYKAPESVIGRMFAKFAPDLIDIAGGVTSTARGGLNLASEGLGDRLFPTTGFSTGTDVDKDSWNYIGGTIVDPVSTAVGMGVGKLVNTVPAMTKGYKAVEAVRASNAARAAGTVAQKVKLVPETILRAGVTGGGAGASTAYLASEGDADSTTMGGVFGTGIGLGIPVAGKILQKTGGFLSDYAGDALGKVKAGQIAREAAGDNLPAIRARLANAPGDLTAGQAVFGINQDPFQALQSVAQSKDSKSFYRQLMERQARQREGMLSAATPDLATAEANRATQFAADNAIAKGAANRARLVRETTVMPPKPVITPTPSNLQPGMTTNVVTPGSIPANLPGIPAIESLKGNPVIGSVIADARRMAAGRQNLPAHLSDLTDDQIADILKDPTKSLEGLQLMKAAIDARFSKNPSAESALAKYDDETITKVKKAFTGAVDTSIPEYGQSRANYATNSGPVNQSMIMEQLRQKLVNPLAEGEQRAGVFAAALDRGQNSALKAAGLNTRFNDSIEAALTPQQFQTIEDISSSLINQRALNKQAREGAGALETIVGENLGKQMKLPGYISTPVNTLNKMIELLTRKVSNQTIEAISEGMKSGRTATEMLDTLPAAERNRILLALGQSGRAVPAVTGIYGAASQGKKEKP